MATVAAMESIYRGIKLLRQPSPKPSRRRYTRIHSRRPRTMLSPPLPSSYSKKADRSSRSNTPGKSPHQESPELSDVPCYTCRRRHVKCDRILPHCAKCAKKGVPCLGYRKPLRWADGVAVRGKLKGKSQPIVDNQAVNVARDVFQESCTSIRDEAAHFGLHQTGSWPSDIVNNSTSYLELINYHNTKICATHKGSEHSQMVVRRIAPLSAEVVQRLPRDILNCILGISAVHMAARNPGNRVIERIALETKVSLFQGISQLFQTPQNHRADILFSCMSLLFAMDIMEHGTSRWSVHFTAALRLLASCGGTENFALHYPHLKLMLTETVHLDTMLVLLLPVSLENPNNTTRKGIKALCYPTKTRRDFFITCPLPLMLAIYDIGDCAQKIFRAHGSPSMADIYQREWILSDVLQFRPEEGVQIVKETYAHRDLSAQEVHAWNIVYCSWRSAIIIVVLRHLYFGLPSPELQLHMSRSPTPSVVDTGSVPNSQFDEPFDLLQEPDELESGYLIEDNVESSFDPGRLSPGFHLADPISRSPSPLHTSQPTTENITLDFWNRRYEIHNEAFSELSSSLLTLADNTDPSYLRYVLMPLMILAFVTRPNSAERALCVTCFERFKQYMSDKSWAEHEDNPPNPVGGSTLDLDIPWDKLDAYSEGVERERRDNVVFVDNQLFDSAPEWNWWYMLERLDLKTVWPISAGTMHMELGSEFWSFSVLSAIVSDECFAAFTQPSLNQQASSSS